MTTGDLLLLEEIPSPPPPKPVYGPVPTRAQVCGVLHQFQGMSVTLPYASTFDPLKARYWFDPLVTQMASQADRMAVYAAHRAAGDTHINISLDLGGLSTLPWVIAVAREAVTLGGLTAVILCCMGDGHGQPNSDPGALGYDWLMQYFGALYAMVRADNTGDPNNSLAHRTIFVPGYDGCIPDWQPPSSVDRFALMARQVLDAGGAGYLGLELSAGYSKWGTDDGIERNNWATPAGQCFDVVLQEGPIDMGPPVPCPAPPIIDPAWSQCYQIVGRMVHPYFPVPGQWDDMGPKPWYLSGGTPRGPFFYDWWEYDAYAWTLPWRHGGRPIPVERVIQHRQAAYAMGVSWVG